MRKVAVITGGSGGIGSACVRAFAGAGWQTVFTCWRHEDRADALCRELRGGGQDAAWFRCDVADPESVRSVFGEIERRYKRIDALVCCAGAALIRLFQDTTEEDWDRLLQVDLLGCVRCDRAVLPGMISRRSGSIVHISSMWGETGASCEVAYSACKAGVIGLTRALAREAGPSGVRVNCVSPGMVLTEMNASLDQETVDGLAEEAALGRNGTADEIARAVLFLAGDGASFITGQDLGVNGGFVI